MAEGQHAPTLGGQIKRPSVELLYSWISEAWGMTDADMVIRSFKKAEVFNALDATEGHLVWDEAETSEEAEKEAEGAHEPATGDGSVDADSKQDCMD